MDLKNMKVMKKKPPNKDSMKKRINTKTRLKEPERNAGPNTDEEEGQAPNQLLKNVNVSKNREFEVDQIVVVKSLTYKPLLGKILYLLKRNLFWFAWLIFKIG